ncbi:MAG: PQQ-dependent catabolism-associated CXXCW motif protein [Hyphomicrobiales bacterium]|nr:PQQ-dependent catabolism-associated CXXCW motif protein [Hyphomicrobiales bacterium]MDE2115506.1 PQQ-dependent catabolism-associated CXXCW motif protein [Hyphomicrobiales bacterium]
MRSRVEILALASAFASLCLCAPVWGAKPPREPDGYFVGAYHSPVPMTLRGAGVVDTAQAHALWLKHQIFVDVLPQPPKPAGLPPGTIFRQKPRYDIPGSIWLPDTGYGQLAGKMQFYFEDGLQKATHGDKARTLVFYCLKDCWMSWNAARRAMRLGYDHVVWYRDGSDGWAGAQFPLQINREAPGR